MACCSRACVFVAVSRGLFGVLEGLDAVVSTWRHVRVRHFSTQDMLMRADRTLGCNTELLSCTLVAQNFTHLKPGISFYGLMVFSVRACLRCF